MGKDLFKKIMDVVFVNFLWVFTSLFTLFIFSGAAFCGVYRVLFKMLRYDEPTSVLKEFKLGFKQNLWFATLVWLSILILLVPLYFLYITSLQTGNEIYLVIVFLGLYQIVLFFLYFFPTLALFETDKPLTMIKNVFFLANQNLWRNFKILGGVAFAGLLVFMVHPVFLVIAIGLCCFLTSFHLYKPFLPYLIKLEPLNEEEE